MATAIPEHMEEKRANDVVENLAVVGLDPHDPQNFPTVQKLLILGVTGLWTFLGTLHMILVGPGLGDISSKLNEAFASSTYLIGGPVLAYGVASLVWVALANRVGVRTVFVLSAVVAGSLSIWGARAQSFGSLVAARTLSSAFMAPPETLGPQMVGDVFRLKDRGKALSFLCILQAGGFCLGPLVGAYILVYASCYWRQLTFRNLGWRWIEYIAAIMCFSLAAAMFVCYPETQYITMTVPVKPNRSAVDNIRFWPVSGGGPPKVHSFVVAFLYPFRFLIHPVVLINSCFFSLCLVVNNFLLTTQSLSYELAYNFSIKSTGLTFFAPAIGCWLSLFVTGYISDLWMSRLAARVGGKPAPEYRLIVLLPTGLLFMAGCLLFGICTQNQCHWVAPAFGSMFIGFGFVAANSISFAYLLDVYEARTDAVMPVFHGIKNFAAFGSTYAIVPWVMGSGYAVPFEAMAGVVVGAHLLMLLLFFLGAFLRKWSAKRFKSAKETRHGDAF